MSANPYQPPKAELADAPEIVPPRPRAVSIALGLVLGVVVLKLLTSIYILQKGNFHIGSSWRWIGRGIDLLLVAFLCHQMGRRRHWARIVLLCLTLLSFAQLCYVIGSARRILMKEEFLAMLPRFVFTTVLPVAMTLAALHLLFFSSGNWFRRQDPG